MTRDNRNGRRQRQLNRCVSGDDVVSVLGLVKEELTLQFVNGPVLSAVGQRLKATRRYGPRGSTRRQSRGYHGPLNQ